MSGLVVLQVADYSASYTGAFIAQLRMLDEEMRQRGTGLCAFAFPASAGSNPWFVELREQGSWAGLLHCAPGRAGLASGREIARVAQASGAGIIHTHFGSYDIPAVVAAQRVRSRGQECRLVWHYRTALEEDLRHRPLPRRLKDLLKFRLAGSRIDACVAVTQALAREASNRGLGMKASALVAGCDTETFKPDPEARARTRAALGVTPHDIFVLHLGWAWHRKGGDLLVEAASSLRQRGVQDLVFATVGAPGPIDPLVRPLPFTDRIHELQQAADIFVSASRSEGFGNGLVEALACGSVAVATLVEGQREIHGGLPGCIEVPANDAAALAHGIEALLDLRSAWPELGVANRAHVVTHYDMRAWAGRMADFYDGLVHLPVGAERS